MKKTLLSLSILSLGIISYAQVGVGTNDPKATLDIVGKPTDTTAPDGVIAPRIKRTELIAKNTIYTTAQTGAIVYVTDIAGTADAAGGKAVDVTAIGYYYFDGTKWIKLTPTPVIQDLRFLGSNNHVTQDAGVGSNGTSLGSGSNNIAIGSNVLSSNTTGSSAIGIGSNALKSANGLNGASSPIAIGNNALQNLTSGVYMTAIGYNALGNASNGGNYSVAIGNSALAVNNNSWNTAVGANSLLAATGDANSSFGYRAGASMITGTSNTYIGASTATYLKSSISHNENTFVGSQVTQSSSDTSPGFDVKYDGVSALGAISLNRLPTTLRAINQSSFFGTNSTVAPSYTGTSIVFGTAIGAQATVGASNSIVLGRLPNSMIDNNGLPTTNPQDNVGIGTIAPTNALHVKTSADPVKFEGLVTDATAANVVVVDGNGVLKTVPKSGFAASTADTSPDAWVNNAANTLVELGTTSAGAARTVGTEVVATDTGRFGIKTPTPNATLEVKKSSTTPTTSVDGVIPPNMTKLELASKVANTYGSAQTGAMVYVTNVTGTITGPSIAQVPYVNAPGYYNFDGITWQPISGALPVILGVMPPPGSTATSSPNVTRATTNTRTNAKITLPNGKWKVTTNILMSTNTCTTAGAWAWHKFTLANAGTTTSTSDLVGATQVSGSYYSPGGTVTGTSGWSYSMVTGDLVINNTSGADKIYDLVYVQMFYNGGITAACTFDNVSNNGAAENNISAIRIQ
ncbi:beta strand repeat-containing protein [Empedobacter sedimenti]|uniref:beta strand repeat-containing protein n=1 Tax=Empedobacter sedimenti TaxID=3042610 RepID=UPI0024A6588F|nr:hypothetical protein [Empedobacter sedimenti]